MMSTIARSKGSVPSTFASSAALVSGISFAFLPPAPFGSVVVEPVHVLDDGEARCAEGVGDQERASVRPVKGNARGRELVVVIGREGAAHDRARGGKVDRKPGRDGVVLDIGDAVRRQERGEDMAVLAGLIAASGASEPTGRPRSRPTL